MNRISFPLTSGMQGDPQVVDLQLAIIALLERGALPDLPANDRERLAPQLRSERSDAAFGPATQQFVSFFQAANDIEETGVVNEETAVQLNDALSQLGLLVHHRAGQMYVVSGRVLRSDGIAAHPVQLYAYHEANGTRVKLGEAQADIAGYYTVRYQDLPGVRHLQLSIHAHGSDGARLARTSPLQSARPTETIDMVVPLTTPGPSEESLQGTVFYQNGEVAPEVSLMLHRHEFGGATSELALAQTDQRGHFALRYPVQVPGCSLEIRARNPHTQQEQRLSRALHSLPEERRSALRLVLPPEFRSQSSEYTRLVESLAPYMQSISELAQAQENTERQDLTILNRNTGWDARLIALASKAHRMAGDEVLLHSEIRAEELYGLFRLGLPTDKSLLSQVAPKDAQQALRKAQERALLPIDEEGLETFPERFWKFARTTKLQAKVPGSDSSYSDLLNASGLGREDRTKFEIAFAAHGSEEDGSDDIWARMNEAAVDGSVIDRLRLQGQFAFLSGNSEPLSTALLDMEVGSSVELVDHDFHEASTWKDKIFALADVSNPGERELSESEQERLSRIIPSDYRASGGNEKVEAYAQDLARRVRASFPTQVVGRRFETDLRYKRNFVSEASVNLLKRAASQGYQLGAAPISAFVAERPQLQGDLSNEDFQASVQQLTTLDRVYQITPTDEAMATVLEMGLTSARDVTAFSRDNFVRRFSSTQTRLFGETNARAQADLLYDKAEQVDAVVKAFAMEALRPRTALPSMVMQGSPELRSDAQGMPEQERNERLKHYPTMESLFGSLDYTELEHCRTVLSPAAYFVDLLKFIDPETPVWRDFVQDWSERRNGEEYQREWTDRPGGARGVMERTPFEALIERRPDLPHLALTCENTKTLLPYIDVVNEILEYLVVHRKLAPEAAHDSDGVSSEQLLAEPQNVIHQAYDILRGLRYPLHLPFDRWLETARAFSNHFETPLQEILAVFAPTQELHAETESYDWCDIYLESLGMSPGLAVIFSDPDPLKHWYELYGFETAQAATDYAEDPNTGQRIDLNSTKTLARRLGVSYRDLVELVQTKFVNPGLRALSILGTLSINISDARVYVDRYELFEDHHELLDISSVSMSAEQLAQVEELRRKAPGALRSDWEDLLSIAEIEEKLVARAAKFGNTPLDGLRSELRSIALDKALVIADTETGPNIDFAELRYADGEPAQPIDFLRLNLFVRLWKSLGWSIEETDFALEVFMPADVPFDGEQEHLEDKPLQTVLINLAHFKELESLLSLRERDRIAAMTMWTEVPTQGADALYRKMFLQPSVLAISSVFDEPSGRFLQYYDESEDGYLPFTWSAAETQENVPAGKVSLQQHLLAVQAALGLRPEDVALILAQRLGSLESTELSLASVSLLHRYAFLAKALDMKVVELITLQQLSGLDPFMGLAPMPLEEAAQDHFRTQTLAFVKLAQLLQEQGLSVWELDAFLRHRFRPSQAAMAQGGLGLAALRLMAAGVQTIEVQHASPVAPELLGEPLLIQKLGLVLDSSVVDELFALMNETRVFRVASTDPMPGRLEPKDFAGLRPVEVMPFDEVRATQSLRCSGVLTLETAQSVKSRISSELDPALKSVLEGLIDQLHEESTRLAREFFEEHLLASPEGEQPQRGFLEEADYSLILEPLPPNATDEELQRHQEARQERLTAVFLPYLRRVLTRQHFAERLGEALELELPQTLRLLVDPAWVDAQDEHPLAVLTRATQPGVSVSFWSTPERVGDPSASEVLFDLDTQRAAQDGRVPEDFGSLRASAYLEVPSSGAYRFFLHLAQEGSQVTITLPDLEQPVLLDASASASDAVLGTEPEQFVELQAGRLYRIEIEATQLQQGHVRLQVQGESLARGPLRALKIYPAQDVDKAKALLARVEKVVGLANRLELSEQELGYWVAPPSGDSGLALSEIPTQRVGDTEHEQALTNQRFAWVRKVLAFARLRARSGGEPDKLVELLRGALVVNEDSPKPVRDAFREQVVSLTGRGFSEIEETLVTLYGSNELSALGDPEALAHVLDALGLSHRMGVPVGLLQRWTGIVNADLEQEERSAIAKEVRDALCARFEPETWNRVAQPIFDKLRQKQRDALVASALDILKLDRLEQLYEYLLIDPGMEPVVQTSRIRLAIASVQLFVQRCLLNLEPRVSPAAIDKSAWEWMKRYRVWEANRKIFLFPENWLEPEFRDDKSPLFEELEGALLQSDATTESTELAFLNYLRGLQEVARLEICATYLEERNVEHGMHAASTLHVIGRTYTEPHRYYYRTRSADVWSPWEKLDANLEGIHIAPIVWKGKLFVFWLTFEEKPDTDANASLGEKSVTSAKFSDLQQAGQSVVREIRLRWASKTGDKWEPCAPLSPEGLASFKSFRSKGADWTKGVRFLVAKEHVAGEERGVEILLRCNVFRRFYLPSENAPLMAGSHREYWNSPYNPTRARANRGLARRGLIARFRERVSNLDSLVALNSEKHTILRGSALGECETVGGRWKYIYRNAGGNGSGSGSLLVNVANVRNRLEQPFFFQDAKNTMFVEPTVSDLPIKSWSEWVNPMPNSTLNFRQSRGVERVEVNPHVDPRAFFDWPPSSLPTVQAPESLFESHYNSDWIVDPRRVLQHDGVLVGPKGHAGITVVNETRAEGTGFRSEDAMGRSIAVVDRAVFEQSGLTRSVDSIGVATNYGVFDIDDFDFFPGESEYGQDS